MLEIAFKTQWQIIDFWKFFVPAAVALLGWIFSRKIPWPWAQRVAVAVLYVGFVVPNLYGLVGSYEMLSTLVAELKSSEVPQDLTPKAFDAAISRLDLGQGWQFLIVLHVVVDLIVLYFILIWSGRKCEP